MKPAAAPVTEDGFVFVPDQVDKWGTPPGTGPGTPPALSHQEITDLAAPFAQLLRDVEARAASQTAAAVAGAVAQVRGDLEGRLGALEGALAEAERRVEQAERGAEQADARAAQLQQALGAADADAASAGAAAARALREVRDLQARAGATAEQIADLDRRLSADVAHAAYEHEQAAAAAAVDRGAADARFLALEARTAAAESACAALEQRVAAAQTPQTPHAPHTQRLDGGAKPSGTGAGSGGPDAGTAVAARRAELRVGVGVTDELRRTQDRVDALAAQLRAEKARSDAMFVKVSAASLVLRGGPLPAEDAKTLLRVSAWLDRFKSKTDDRRLRERADAYIAKIDEKTAGSR